MFDRIFTDYLLQSGKLTKSEIAEVFKTHDTARARLGVIAVSEQLMTIEQADEVNNLQSVYDKRFGDIAIDKGYLTQDQVDRLVCLQGNQFLTTLQTMVDLKYLTMDEINQSLLAFQKEHGYTLMNMEDLKSCDVAKIIPLYLFQQPVFTQNFCGLIIRTLIRLLDHHTYIGTPYITDEVSAHCLSMQQLLGDHSLLCCIHADSEEMIAAAKLFAGEKYITCCDDALDALCELVNCINGMYATELALENVELDMDIPHYYLDDLSLTSKSMLCIPIKFQEASVDISIILDEEFRIH